MLQKNEVSASTVYKTKLLFVIYCNSFCIDCCSVFVNLVPELNNTPLNMNVAISCLHNLSNLEVWE